MKQLLSLFALLAVSITAHSQNLRFDKTEHNFGTIEESGGKVSHTFTYTNASSKPIVIVDVSVSCGCTTPYFSREPLAAGASEKLTIEFDPINRPGRIAKKIVVVTNDGNYNISIDGNVNPRPRSLTERYPFALDGGARLDGLGHFAMQVPLSSEQTVSIGVANTGAAVPVSVGIDQSQLPSGVSATVSSQLLAAGQEGKIHIRVRGAGYGAFTYQIPLLINGRRTAETITVSGAVVDDFSAMSDEQMMNGARAKFGTYYYRFGDVSVGKQYKGSIEIVNRGKSPLIIRGIEGSAQVEARVDRRSIAPGGSGVLTVSYRPGRVGYDSGWVRLVVNDPVNPTPEVRFVATVSE